jgi:hypothetical protein
MGGASIRTMRGISVLTASLLVAAGCGTDTQPAGSAPARPAGAAGDPLDPEQLARTFGDAVWQVEVDGCGIESGGSSFAIGADLLVTNRHVVEFDRHRRSPPATARSCSRPASSA